MKKVIDLGLMKRQIDDENSKTEKIAKAKTSCDLSASNLKRVSFLGQHLENDPVQMNRIVESPLQMGRVSRR
jgi:hypothetical protein